CQCTVAFHASVQKVPTLHVPQVPSSKRYHDMSPYCRYHRVDSARTIQRYLIALTGVDRRDRLVLVWQSYRRPASQVWCEGYKSGATLKKLHENLSYRRSWLHWLPHGRPPGKEWS